MGFGTWRCNSSASLPAHKRFRTYMCPYIIHIASLRRWSYSSWIWKVIISDLTGRNDQLCSCISIYMNWSREPILTEWTGREKKLVTESSTFQGVTHEAWPKFSIQQGNYQEPAILTHSKKNQRNGQLGVASPINTRSTLFPLSQPYSIFILPPRRFRPIYPLLPSAAISISLRSEKRHIWRSIDHEQVHGDVGHGGEDSCSVPFSLPTNGADVLQASFHLRRRAGHRFRRPSDSDEQGGYDRCSSSVVGGLSE